MLRIGSELKFSASDLVGYFNCGHLTTLDRKVADGTLAKPKTYDPLLEILQERGAQHEAAYIDHLRDAGLEVTFVEGKGIDKASVAPTLA